KRTGLGAESASYFAPGTCVAPLHGAMEGNAMPRAMHSTTAFIIVAFLLFFLGFMLKTLVGAATIQGDDENRAMQEAGADSASRIAPPLRLSSLRINRTENGLTLARRSPRCARRGERSRSAKPPPAPRYGKACSPRPGRNTAKLSPARKT